MTNDELIKKIIKIKAYYRGMEGGLQLCFNENEMVDMYLGGFADCLNLLLSDIGEEEIRDGGYLVSGDL